jgi:hypothetical protein
MSTTLYGKRADGSRIALDIEHPAYLNMSSANARAFFEFLRIEPRDEPSGGVSIHAARRVVIRARATFQRRVGGFVREPTDIKAPGKARVLVDGIDEGYFERRLADFETFVRVVGEMGAKVISWD